MTEWTKDKEKKILFKYRFTFTLKIIRVIAAIILIFMVYMMGVNIIFHKTHADKKHTFYSNLALEWTNPNISGAFSPGEMSEITSFLTQKITYPVYRTIGKEQQYIGEMKLSKPLFTPFATSELKIQNPKTDDWYDFYLPKDPKTDKQLPAIDASNVWKTLEKVDSGTVADLAFSTKSYMTPAELLKQLSPFDVDVLWMALYSGEFKLFTPNSWGGGDAISVAPFGLAGGKEISNNYLSQSGYALVEESIAESEQLMLQNMQYLLKNERKSYYETFLGLDHLQERYDYLQEYGFQVYGAVVTGPVKELLKLKDVEEIQGVQLGKLEYWNWDN